MAKAEQDPEIKAQLMSIGKRLKKYRKEKFSSYEKFSYVNDINRVQYGRYENGEDMKVSSLLKVLKALGISIEEFFKEDLGL